MILHRVFFLSLLCLSCVLAPVAEASEKFVTIGTADELGVYYPTGGAICRLLKRGTKEHGIRCFVESTDGSIYNLNGIRGGELDLGIAQTDWVYHAFHGTEDFAGVGANTKLRALASLHMEAFTVVVRNDSQIKTFKDLRGKRVNIGNKGSGVRATMERIMKLEKWSDKSFKSLTEFKLADQGRKLCNGELDAIVYMAGHPNGAINEVTGTCDTRIIPVEGEEITALMKQSPFYFNAIIPGGMYKGNKTSINTIGTKALLVTSEELDENSVYEIVKAIFDNLDNFKTLHPVFASLDKQTMATLGLIVPLHPGAVRYFKEKGILPQ